MCKFELAVTVSRICSSICELICVRDVIDCCMVELCAATKVVCLKTHCENSAWCLSELCFSCFFWHIITCHNSVVFVYAIDQVIQQWRTINSETLYTVMIALPLLANRQQLSNGSYLELVVSYCEFGKEHDALTLTSGPASPFFIHNRSPGDEAVLPLCWLCDDSTVTFFNEMTKSWWKPAIETHQ